MGWEKPVRRLSRQFSAVFFRLLFPVFVLVLTNYSADGSLAVFTALSSRQELSLSNSFTKAKKKKLQTLNQITIWASASVGVKTALHYSSDCSTSQLCSPCYEVLHIVSTCSSFLQYHSLWNLEQSAANHWHLTCKWTVVHYCPVLFWNTWQTCYKYLLFIFQGHFWVANFSTRESHIVAKQAFPVTSNTRPRNIDIFLQHFAWFLVHLFVCSLVCYVSWGHS